MYNPKEVIQLSGASLDAIYPGRFTKAQRLMAARAARLTVAELFERLEYYPLSLRKTPEQVADCLQVLLFVNYEDKLLGMTAISGLQ